MPEVEIKKGESVDRALKRLKNKLEAEGIMDEMRRLRAFETPIQRYRRKQRTAAKKNAHAVPGQPPGFQARQLTKGCRAGTTGRSSDCGTRYHS